MLQPDEIDSLIGNTPLRRVPSIEPPGVELWAKIESFNLSGSIKARPAWEMLRQAELSGKISPGSTLIEPTSGNTGIALALLSRLRGMNFWGVLPENSTEERISLLRSLGARLTFSPAEEGSNGAIRLARQIAAEHEITLLDQYNNPANVEAHLHSTGPEIWRDLPGITLFVAGLGTSGTLMGAGQYLKQKNSSVGIVAAEPLPGEKVQGLRSLEEGFIPEIFDTKKLDRKILVRAEEAIEGTRRFLDAGILAGISSGANLHAALRVASPGDRVVCIVADSLERYLSTGALEGPSPDWSGWW